MSVIEDVKRELQDIEHGIIRSDAVQALARLTRKLVHEIEGKPAVQAPKAAAEHADTTQ